MSAFVVIFTAEGFIVAADGKTTWDGKEQIPAVIAERLKHDRQKIFEVPGQTFAYFVSGFFESDDQKFNMDVEIDRQITSLSDEGCYIGYDYVKQIAIRLKAAIIRAQRENGLILPEGPDCEGRDGESEVTVIVFVGYFKGLPFSVHLAVNHRSQSDATIHIRPVNGLSRGYALTWDSEILPGLAVSGDTQFSKYRDGLQLPYAKSLNDAANYAETRIRLCCDPLAASVDPACEVIGGHVHIAVITPSGFRWHIPPKEKGDSV